MGQRGPVPRRIDNRAGHLTKAQKNAVSKLHVGSDVEIPSADEDWHPIAYRWYQSLTTSPQSVYYLDSDWATAYYIAEVITKNLEDEKFNSSLFANIMSAMSNLLVTVGDRRRAQVEIERELDNEEDDAVAAVDEQFKQLTASL